MQSIHFRVGDNAKDTNEHTDKVQSKRNKPVIFKRTNYTATATHYHIVVVHKTIKEIEG